MTKQKGLPLSLSLTLFWIASLTHTANAQNVTISNKLGDSLTLVPIPKYVLYRMFKHIEIGRVCDSLATYQHGVITRAVRYINFQDSLIQTRGSQIGNLRQEAKWWEERYATQLQMVKVERAEARKWKFATIVGGVFIVIIAIL
jgi:hypothetical protein